MTNIKRKEEAFTIGLVATKQECEKHTWKVIGYITLIRYLCIFDIFSRFMSVRYTYSIPLIVIRPNDYRTTSKFFSNDDWEIVILLFVE